MAVPATEYSGNGEVGEAGALLDMLAHGNPAWHPDAACKEAAMALVHEVLTSRRETERYRNAVAELRRVLEALDRQTG